MHDQQPKTTEPGCSLQHFVGLLPVVFNAITCLACITVLVFEARALVWKSAVCDRLDALESRLDMQARQPELQPPPQQKSARNSESLTNAASPTASNLHELHPTSDAATPQRRLND